MIDLERKTENAMIAHLSSFPELNGVRFRHNQADSTKVNRDIVVIAKRGDATPAFSSVFNIELTVEVLARAGRSNETLPDFLTLCSNLENALCINNGFSLARRLSALESGFHCYESNVLQKDNTPQDEHHSCVYTLAMVCMASDFAASASLNK